MKKVNKNDARWRRGSPATLILLPPNALYKLIFLEWCAAICAANCVANRKVYPQTQPRFARDHPVSRFRNLKRAATRLRLRAQQCTAQTPLRSSSSEANNAASCPTE